MGELTLPPLQLTVPVRRGQILLPHFWTTPLHAETLHLLYSFIHDHCLLSSRPVWAYTNVRGHLILG